MKVIFLSFPLIMKAVDGFQFPKIKFIGIPSFKSDEEVPRSRVEKGPEEEELLLRSVINHCQRDKNEHTNDVSTCLEASFYWEPALEESYSVACKIFEEIFSYQKSTRSPRKIILSFPSMSRQTDLENLANVLQSNECGLLLGIEDAVSELYPSSPAPYISITFPAESDVEPNMVVKESEQASCDDARTNTEDWVNNFLGLYRLCPYTSSVTRAAVGLKSVGVPVGGVHITVGHTGYCNIPSKRKLNAAEVTSLFWSEVSFLLNSPQDEWATSLLVFPAYDLDFDAFIEICDKIVEPSVVATKSTDYIGRAWFHPLYNADAVGHSTVIAGHAIPHKMVEQFRASSNDGNKKELHYDSLARANDLVRQTPHATINILRRSQLTKAGDYEKSLGHRGPKPNSVYVRNAVRLSDSLLGNE
mmetsp:Transcript_26700/g.56237  ORF Transcript_26700/g.56237 Transcript_26700/m.56237 type:complete len:417 (+) Transcript_26700:49-1299(+)